MKSIEQLIDIIEEKIVGQGNQLDISGMLSNVLREIVGYIGTIGELAELETDHKSTLVQAVNEVFDVVETPEYVISMSQSTEERKKIYNECILHPQIAKNIVFFNDGDSMYYPVNAYKIANSVLYLNAIMTDTGVVRSVAIQVGSNGTISIPT